MLMNHEIVSQLPLEEVRKILREELSAFLANIPAATSNNPSQELLNLAGASRYLNLSPNFPLYTGKKLTPRV